MRWIKLIGIFLAFTGWIRSPDAAAQPSFLTFESAQVRPLALSPDGRRLFAVNTPDGRLEVFLLTGSWLRHEASIPVGMEPVAVAARDDREVWVVNHLSDSVSVVDLAAMPPRVVRTLLVGDEPNDIVFAGPDRQRAFITTAHRGQNSPFGVAEATVSGIGRADVWVFDARDLGVALGGEPEQIVTLFGDKPRALAVSPDGSRVYAAIFHSGNKTTTLSKFNVCPDGASAPPCESLGVTFPGGVPAPNENVEGIPGPRTGLIVRYEEDLAEWRDELGRNWNDVVRFDLPDLDIFEIDAAANPPVQLGAVAGVGTILFNMAVNPVTGRIYASNTEAHNEVRFEGPGILAATVKPPGEPASVRGRLHLARIAVLERDSLALRHRHLNKHIDYELAPQPTDAKENSLAIPVGMQVTSDGNTLYVAAFGSGKIGVFDTARLESDVFVPDAAHHIELGGGGPSGLALDELRQRLYVLTRFDNSITVVDIAARETVGRVPLHNSEPRSVLEGRPFLYDARLTSSNGEASCASCHVFGDMDDLAWDLGNPDAFQEPDPNPQVFENPSSRSFHPLKGPMTTQSLRGLANHGTMHWRGDRTGSEVDAFNAFNVAFGGLVGRDEGPLTETQMQAFTDFALQITYPPNPLRRLDNSRRADEERGLQTFFTQSDTVGLTPPGTTCNDCHTIDPQAGFFGTSGLSFGEFKIPHFRNLYQKIGMFGKLSAIFNPVPSRHMGNQIRGFGFTHDGGVDTLQRFLLGAVFRLSFAEVRDLEAFLLTAESNLAPIVGQQVTLFPGSGPDVDERVDLLRARALAPFAMLGAPDARECELVVKGVLEGEVRGWVLDADTGAFRSDREGEALIPDSDLREIARAPGQGLTYTCAPPGSGSRMGIDRDEDGSLDRDELDVRTDPAHPGSVWGACSDGIDNDRDGDTDFPADLACLEAGGNSEVAGPVAITIEKSHRSWRKMLFGRRPIEVVILGAPDVDVGEIAGLAFGPNGTAPKHRFGTARYRRRHERDVNGDGFVDLLSHYRAVKTGLTASDTRVCLQGTLEGTPFHSCTLVPVAETGKPVCGFGFDLAILLPPLLWLRRGRKPSGNLRFRTRRNVTRSDP